MLSFISKVETGYEQGLSCLQEIKRVLVLCNLYSHSNRSNLSDKCLPSISPYLVLDILSFNFIIRISKITVFDLMEHCVISFLIF